MKGKLHTSYFSKIKKGEGVKISIARYNPKWLKPGDIDLWFEDLAPSTTLLNDYKHKGISWSEYTERYLYDICHTEKTKNCFIKLGDILDSGKDVTIYCYEKPSNNCHRHILGSIFKCNGYEVKEIE